MANYNYHEDQRIREAAEKYDAVCPRAYERVINNSEEIGCPLYSVEIMLESFKIPCTSSGDEVLDSALSFMFSMISLFGTYHTMENKSVEDVEYASKGLVIKLFDDYRTRISKLGISDGRIEALLIEWRDVTIGIVKEAFEQMPFSYDIYKEERDNINLLKQILYIVSLNYIEWSSANKIGSPSDERIILYNFWEDELDILRSNIKHSFALSEEEQQICDPIQNLLLFLKHYHQTIELACSEAFKGNPNQSYLGNTRTWLSNLLHDFSKDLRRREIVDPGTVSRWIRHWADVTKNMIDVEVYIEEQIYRLNDYHLGDIVHPYVFRSSKKREWDALEELKRNGTNYVDYISNDYLEKIEHGDFRFPWAEELEKLKLDYKTIYNALYENHYFTGMTYPLFKDAIVSADLSVIQDRLAARANVYGGFRILVCKIGEHCPTWFKAAAPTLKDSNKKPYDTRTIQKSITGKDKPFSKQFYQVLDDYKIIIPAKKEANFANRL